MVNPKLRFEVLKRDEFRCRYCNAQRPASGLHVDHVIPRAKGGGDDMSNLVAACIDCNQGKSDIPLTNKRAGLVGLFVHTRRRDKPEFEPSRQGEIKAEPLIGTYLIQWYSWADGTPTFSSLVQSDDLRGARFFEKREDWLVDGRQYCDRLARMTA